MTDAKIKDLVASLAISQKETDRHLKETREIGDAAIFQSVSPFSLAAARFWA
ncbi:MAG: hypothetical protein ACRER2_17350 [Methylococcales bacterium]